MERVVTDATVPLLGGRYRLGELLGRGGMARVYRAQDELLGRAVAVKVFDTDHNALPDEERRRSEMRVLASLNHPALISIFDGHLEPDPHPYFVMELVEGRALNERLGSGPLPAADVALMTQELGDALSVVHSAGVVHRDIKPSNVLLADGADGRAFRAKLGDFGIAVFADGARLTMPGTLMGTAAYLAPEQLRGGPPAPSADIYSLGLVVLECLTGQRAFPGAAAEAMSARLLNDPGIPQSVPVALRELIVSMTARDPAQRPTASEVARKAKSAAAKLEAEDPADALVTMASGSPGESAATAVLSTERLERTAPRRAPHRWRLVLVIAVTAAVLAGLSPVVLAALPAAAPEPVSLPATSEPLSSHLQQLLESVTP